MLKTKSCRISYRKLIVNDIRKAVFFLFSQLCIVHFSFFVIRVIFRFSFATHFIARLRRIFAFFFK